MKSFYLLTIWYGIALATNSALSRRGKRAGSPLLPDAKRQKSPSESSSRSPSPRPSSRESHSGDFSMSRSRSRDSYDTTSLRARVDGPGSLNVGRAPFDLTVGRMAQMSQKVWHTQQVTSRTSLKQPSWHPDGRQARVIAKGTNVKARLDTTRGGYGYIRTKGREGTHTVRVEPGNVVTSGATGIRNSYGYLERARLKAELTGGGVLTTKSRYRDKSDSSSMSPPRSVSSSGADSGGASGDDGAATPGSNNGSAHRSDRSNNDKSNSRNGSAGSPSNGNRPSGNGSSSTTSDDSFGKSKENRSSGGDSS